MVIKFKVMRVEE